ncbi:hypothetical protein GCM10011613_07710 [Cellvibrio zantedeschiae]|uniref:Uncharacterized protein n=1 Tax=Cellvibrio zantedeschiae TaxID=1237077 RepID=A0ABQ3AUB0_9GAMM|nr:hypothetical protein GCM10011613_07710 [Cellvibrio zantedeschiae]
MFVKLLRELDELDDEFNEEIELDIFEEELEEIADDELDEDCIELLDDV